MLLGTRKAERSNPIGGRLLLSLDLSGNAIGNELASLLLEPLRLNATLTALNLKGTGIDDAAKQAILDAFVPAEGEPERAKPLYVHTDPMAQALAQEEDTAAEEGATE